MPGPDFYKDMARLGPKGPQPEFHTAKPAQASATDILLKELITEVRGLRRDMRAERLLPDTPETRRIRAELDAGNS